MVDENLGETRQAVIGTTKSGATITCGEDDIFSIARDYAWAHNVEYHTSLGYRYPVCHYHQVA